METSAASYIAQSGLSLSESLESGYMHVLVVELYCCTCERTRVPQPYAEFSNSKSHVTVSNNT